MENKYLNKNEVIVIGTLVSDDLKIDQSKNGQTYIQGDIGVKTVIGGKEQVFNFKLFSFQYKKGTTEINGLFKTYSELSGKVGKRVKVIGTIDENRFFQEKTGQIVSFNYNNGRFIYNVDDKTPDQATFEFAGYVEKPIHERTNKDGEVLHYEIVIAQANYNGTEPVLVKFEVPKDNRRAIAYMERNYDRGATVSVNGLLTVEVTTVTKEEEVAFGEPNIKEYTNVFKNYEILSGSEPIVGKNEYTSADIRKFTNAYEDKGIELQAKAKETTKTNPTSDAKKTSATSLL